MGIFGNRGPKAFDRSLAQGLRKDLLGSTLALRQIYLLPTMAHPYIAQIGYASFAI